MHTHYLDSHYKVTIYVYKPLLLPKNRFNEHLIVFLQLTTVQLTRNVPFINVY